MTQLPLHKKSLGGVVTDPDLPICVIPSTFTCLRQVKGEMTTAKIAVEAKARTRISCHAALERAACAPFREVEWPNDRKPQSSLLLLKCKERKFRRHGSHSQQ